MNNQFLSSFQEAPRPEFAESLYAKINIPIKTQSMPLRRFTLGFALAALALALMFVFSPSARAYAQEIIYQIGRLFISHEPTYAEQFEKKINSGTPTATADPKAVPLQWQAPPLLSVAEASAQAGLPISEIADLPEGMNIATRFVTLQDENNPFTQVTTTYNYGASSIVLSQTLYKPDAASQKLPVGESAVTQVTVQGANGLWIENMRLSTYVDDNNLVALKFASVLIWEKDGFEYWLQSTPGLSLDEMLNMANSVKP
jgi:hypothetical protein